MAFLIDTNLISELRKKHRCDRNVVAWQASISGQDLFISVVSMMEIRLGILRARRQDTAFADILEEWYERQVKPAFTGRILGVDLAISEYCSELLHERTRGMADALIAATAGIHDLTLATRNTVDFADTGIRLVNPWESVTH